MNMDTLLEESAAAARGSLAITHLHGRWNHPEEISTTISQYLAELHPAVEEALAAALSGKRVLVAGYSARDRDIQPLFLKYAPASLTWLVHPTSENTSTDPAAIRREELAPEAIYVLDTLRSQGRTAVIEKRTTIGGHVPDPPTLDPRRQPELRSRDVESIRREVTRAYTAVEEWRRRLSVGAVLFDQGFGGAVGPALHAPTIPREEPLARVAAAKLRARASRREGHRWHAIVALVRPLGGNYVVQARNVANEVAATLPGTRLHWLADPIDKCLARLATGRTLFLIQTRLAQRQSSRGALTTADESFARLATEHTKAEVGLGNWVNLRTWHADVLKALGRIDAARSMLARDLDETFYADQAQTAALKWKLSELALVTRGPTPGVLAELSDLASFGREALGINQHCWIQLTRMGTAGVVDVRSLESIARLRADTYMFYFLQHAEGLRSEGDLRQAKRLARQALRIERDRSRWKGSRTGRLAAQLIIATACAQQGAPEAPAKLAMLAANYERMGALLPAARARCNAALAAGHDVEPDVVASWRDSEWIVEAERAGGRGDLSDRWQIVM